MRDLLLDRSASELVSRPLVLRGFQIFLCISGFGVVAWAFVDAGFRNAEGFLRGTFCLPFSSGIALIILGCAVAGRFKRFAFWFALTLVGQAVALQMIEAGPFVRYQHYKPLNQLFTENALFLTYLAAQTVFVVAGFRSRWSIIRAWIIHHFKVWQLVGMGMIILLTGATVSRELPVYLAEVVFAAFVQSLNVGSVVLMAWALPDETLSWLKQKSESWFGQPGVHDQDSDIQNPKSQIENRVSVIQHRKPVLSEVEGSKTCPERGRRIENSTLDRFAVIAALWVTVVAALLSVFVYEQHPHVQDEVIYLYQAGYFADWKLTVPAPPVPEAFSLYMIPYRSERWYSIFPPGWPAVLAVGVVFGVSWLVNPLLAGLNLLLAYLFIQEIYDRRVARIAVLLLCTSPWYVFMAMNFMAHTFTLTAALLASLAIAWARRTGKATWGWIAGFAVGVVSLVRPLDGLIMAGLLAVWAIGVGGKRLKTSSIVAFVIGTAAVASVVLPYNRALTGDPTVFPLTAYYERYFGPKTNALGFGPERGLGWPIDPFPGHSPIESLINANLNIFSINIELFGWSTGSLVFIGLILFSGKLRKRDYLMLTVVAAVVGVYSLYWFSGGPDFGARYWYLLLIPLVVLTVKGIEILEKMLQPAPYGVAHAGIYAIIAVISLCTFSLLNYFPWRALDKYHHYLGMRSDIVRLARDYMFGKSLVLIRGDENPDYASAWMYNPLDPNAEVPVYAWDRSPKVRAQTLRAYSDRPVWLVNGPKITHGGFKLVAGPLSAAELLGENNQAQ